MQKIDEVGQVECNFGPVCVCAGREKEVILSVDAWRKDLLRG